MNILPLNTYNSNYNYKKTNFCAGVNNNLLKFKNEDFFININGYGKNKDWAKSVINTANRAVVRIKHGETSDEVLRSIAKGIKIANGFCKDITKRQHTGILRTLRSGYGNPGEWNGVELVTPITSKYKSYEKQLKKLEKKPFKSPFEDIDVAKVESGNFVDYDIRIVHPDDIKVNSALDRIGGKFFNLKKDYISKPENVTGETLPQINSDIAEIRWIMAHSMPWERGSDSISNVFMRSIYKSMGIKTYPLKEGISLDFEAFCTPLNKYKQKFSSYFEKAPEIIE